MASYICVYIYIYIYINTQTHTHAYIHAGDTHTSNSDSDSEIMQGYHPARRSNSRGSNRDSRDNHIPGNTTREYRHTSPSREYYSAPRLQKGSLFPGKDFARIRASVPRGYYLEDSERDALSEDGSYFGGEFGGDFDERGSEFAGVYGREHWFRHVYDSESELHGGDIDAYGRYLDAYAHRDGYTDTYRGVYDEREESHGGAYGLQNGYYRGAYEDVYGRERSYGDGDEDMAGFGREEERGRAYDDAYYDRRRKLQLRALKRIRRYVCVYIYKHTYIEILSYEEAVAVAGFEAN
jgi:hypothetical protein